MQNSSFHAMPCSPSSFLHESINKFKMRSSPCDAAPATDGIPETSHWRDDKKFTVKEKIDEPKHDKDGAHLYHFDISPSVWHPTWTMWYTTCASCWNTTWRHGIWHDTWNPVGPICLDCRLRYGGLSIYHPMLAAASPKADSAPQNKMPTHFFTHVEAGPSFEHRALPIELSKWIEKSECAKAEALKRATRPHRIFNKPLPPPS